MVHSSDHEHKVRDFLRESLKDIMSVVKADCGSLLLFDDKTKELVLESFHNPGASVVVDKVKFRVGEGISGKVMEQKAPVLVKDVDQDPRFGRNGFKHYLTKSFISVPLVSPDGVLGVINLADKSDGKAFCEKDLEFVTSLAQYACIIAYNLNLAEKLRREKDELDRQKSLLEKYASVGKLAASVVHEVNNPLDGIIRFTNMLLKQIDEKSVMKEYLLEIKRGLNRIENITKSLLQFSHQVNNTYKHTAYIDIQDAISDALGVFSERLAAAVTVKTDFGLGSTRIADLGLSHVFINLIKNSLDAMPAGGLLTIRTQRVDGYIRIIFKDSGCGMSSEVRERIFEPFFTTKSLDKGTGLGLSICREIVSRYEGQIDCDSLPGQGAEFTLIIPARYLAHA